MHISVFTLAIMAVSGAHAATHKAAACVSNRISSPVGGTPFSPSYNWQTTYEVLADATKCACDMYNQRSTGDEWWDTCTDCTFDGTICNSAEGHIGGDEFTYYCEEKCGAQGAEAD
ncbi:hypothetical protein FPCIR_11167 [Fusarium pseudocircinatum]|uniref:Uncharacterized protein n=1 Tax=Fusarium pseudocircinatum TaxID=56676 RepID=A0A8H5KRN4_9HYPO|nr:hypothetical protein FPCIR_11167 [Fusarium pseudocircinatum]